MKKHMLAGPLAIALIWMIGLSIGTGLAASLSVNSKALTPYRTCTVTATPSSTTTVIDANVRQGSATTNFGTFSTMDVSASGTSNRRIYIKFDLSGCTPSIPASAIIRLATLRIYVTVLEAVCRTLDIFKVTTSWTETVITWNNQPFGTSLNNPSSGSRTDSFDVGTPVGCENRAAGYVIGAIVTADVATYVAGTSTNNGWMIRDDAEGGTPARTETFSDKTLNAVAQSGQLIVTYVTVT
jgi:hypothetical protein